MRSRETLLDEIRRRLAEHGVPKVFADLVLSFISELARLVRITGVLLYGSVARRAAVYGKSDVDLIVVSPDFPRDYSELVRMRRRVRPRLPGGVDSLWVSEEELEEMFRGLTGFVLDALYEGVILYDERGFLKSLRDRLLRALREGKLERWGRMWRIPVRRAGECVEVEL